MNIHHQALELVGRVYIHPVSKELVVFSELHGLEILTWRKVSGSNYGRTLASTVLKDDGRWQLFTGNVDSPMLPYSYRS